MKHSSIMHFNNTTALSPHPRKAQKISPFISSPMILLMLAACGHGGGTGPSLVTNSTSLSLQLAGDEGANALQGAAANDTLDGGAGDDTLDGAAGTDLVTYEDDPAGVIVNLAQGTATDGWGDTDTLRNIEQVKGSGFDDELTGDDGDN